MLTRRELIQLLGTSAAAGVVLACGPKARKLAVAGWRIEELRPALREAVAKVRSRHASASGWAALREHTSLIAGSGERGTARRYTATIVLRARGDRGVHERVIGDPDPAAIAEAADELAALGRGGGALDPGGEEDHADGAPLSGDRTDWLGALDATLARVEARTSSRIVWRAAHAQIDDDRTWFVGDGRDVAQRTVRVRAGVTLMAWSGTRPMIGELVRARAGGAGALVLDDDEVDRAALRALELLTPGEPPFGPAAMVLDPSVVAAAIAAGVGGALTTAAWPRPDLRARALLGQPVGTPAITIDDVPGYVADDGGLKAARTPVIAAGVLTAVLSDADGAARTQLPRTGHGRRAHGTGAVAPRPSELVMAPGAATAEELRAAIGDGLVLEDADGAVVDPATWQLTVRARRARKVVRGKLSGHAWTDVELRAALPQLLGDATALGAATASHGGVTAPALATRATLSPRRGG